tara:strand:- start:761 stop:1237 length:477 start_codon:yes stop_codon:yes gene_type:complete
MPIQIHGKEYYTVAERIQMLHNSDFTEVSLTTEILHHDEKIIIMKTTLEIDGNVFTGIAQETKGSSNINTTSWAENCETSSCGRALALAGFGSVESIASADEVKHAIDQQEPRLASDKQKYLIKKLDKNNNLQLSDTAFDSMTMQEANKIITELNKEK